MNLHTEPYLDQLRSWLVAEQWQHALGDFKKLILPREEPYPLGVER